MCGKSFFSNSMGFLFFLQDPVAPSNLRINSSTSTSLTLSWDTPSPLNGPLGVYELRYTVDQSQPLTILVFKTTFTIVNIQVDTTYHYSIRAATIGQLGEALWGPYSNDIWVRNGMSLISLSATQFSLFVFRCGSW